MKLIKYTSILDRILIEYSTIQITNKIQKKVAKLGFEYNTNEHAIDKIIEEANELKKEIKKDNNKKIKEELGDLFFACLDVSRKLNYNPEEILKKGNKKFILRWKILEKLILKDKKNIHKIKSKELNKYWELAKKINFS